jgi:tRNA/rRNA methyltransferase
LPSPAIILARPQLGENIGAAARAMGNFGLGDLRLVNPRDGWPNEKAAAMAAGAAHIVTSAKLFPSLKDALADLQIVYATTARDRDVAKQVLTPEEAAKRLREADVAGMKTGILFGAERAGLDNDEVSLADAIINIPADPAFTSFNLGQAVLLTGYEWFKIGDATPAERIDHGGVAVPATREELFQLFGHLEDELLKSGFLYPPDKSPPIIRNLRALLHRAGMTNQEVRTLRGVVTALTKGKHRVRREDK